MGSTSSRLASFIYPILIASTCSLIACGGGGGGDNSPPPDNTPPTGSIIFPPPASFTLGGTITVRGTAADASGISSVEVNGISATTSDDYANWIAEDVPLMAGDNSLVVSITDTRSNTNADAASASIVWGDAADNFPNADYPIAYIYGMDLDEGNGLIYITHPPSSSSSLRGVYSVDMNTGARNEVASNSNPNNEVGLSFPYDVSYDSVGNKIYVVDGEVTSVLKVIDLVDGLIRKFSTVDAPNSNPPFLNCGSVEKYEIQGDAGLLSCNINDNQLIKVDTEEAAYGQRTILSDNINFPDGNNPLDAPSLIAFNSTNKRAYVLQSNSQAILSIDLVDGSREILSDSTTPDSQNAFNLVSSMFFDATNNQLLVSDDGLNSLLIVETEDGSTPGKRTLLSSNTFPNDFNPFSGLSGLVVDSTGELAYVADSILTVVDMRTGHRVILSK